MDRSAVQYLFASRIRLLRDRPLRVTEGVLQENLTELLSKWKSGMLEVHTPDGRVVDLATLVPVRPQIPVMAPDFPLDSIKNDKIGGQRQPIFPGGAVQVAQEEPGELLPIPGVMSKSSELETKEAESVLLETPVVDSAEEEEEDLPEEDEEVEAEKEVSDVVSTGGRHKNKHRRR